MLKTILVLLFSATFVVNSQRTCRARFNNSTGLCTTPSTCTGSSVSSETCDTATCCINTTVIPTTPNCFNQTLFTQIYPTSRGLYIAQVLNYAINQADICGNCRATAAFLAIAATITNDFLYDEAVGNDATFRGDDQRFGNNVTGDGSRYRSRGFFGIRGKVLYEKFQSIYPTYRIYVNPQQASDTKTAAEIAANLWRNPTRQTGASTPLTSHADGTFYGLSILWYKLTGGIENLPSIAKKYSFFLRLFQCGGDLYPGQGEQCRINATTTGYCVPMCIQGMEDISYTCGCGSRTSANCTGTPGHIQCCADPCSQELKMDLGLVLDSSFSITAAGYELLRKFVKDLLNQTNVGPNKTHVGIINFSATSEILTYLNQNMSLSQKQAIVDRAPFLAQGTNTAGALQQANTLFDTKRGLRLPEEGASQVIFVITDGESNDEVATVNAASVLKNKGIYVISVGVGSRLRYSELYAMCTRPSSENYFAINDYASLSSRLNQFVSKSCSEAAAIPWRTTVTSDVSAGKYKFFKLKIAANGTKVMIQLKLAVGKVKVFFSFTSRNPKDPNDFLNVVNAKAVGIEVESSPGSTSMFDVILGKKQKTTRAQEEFVSVIVEKPKDIEHFDEVNVGVKGVEGENKFEMTVEDCQLVSCLSSGNMSYRLSLSIVLICLLSIVIVI